MRLSYQEKIQGKMASPTMALIKVAASLWRGTLDEAKAKYTCVTHGDDTRSLCVALPKETGAEGLGSVAKLIILQDKFLRSITGAYTATNVKVLESGGRCNAAGYVSRSNSRGLSRDALGHAKETIRKKLRSKKRNQEAANGCQGMQRSKAAALEKSAVDHR